MRKLFYLLPLLLFLSARPASAQLANAQGWCEQGATVVVTSGLQSTNQVQGSFPSCVISVSIHGGGTATIYSTGSSVPLSNPFTAGTTGRWIFYAVNGEYDITMTGGGLTSPVTYSDVFITNVISSGGGGGGTPCVTTANSLQYNNAGAFGCASGLITPDGNNLVIKGPDPIVDVSAYGARASVLSLTDGSTNVQCFSGSPTVTLASASSFINGDGVTLQGCGATNTMSTPGAPTVTPIYANGGTRTHNTVNSATGSSTYQYLIVAQDKFGGLTAAGSSTTITNGLSSLGVQTVVVSSVSRSNDTVTVTLSTPVNFVSNMLLDFVGGANTTGWYKTCSITDTTHFTFCSTPTDTRNEGASAFDYNSSSTAGSAAWYQGNKVTWTAVTGAWKYYVCAERPGDASFHVIGQTFPSDSGTGWTDVQFEDWGATYLSNQTFPFYVSDSICSGSGTNDELTTTIASGGGTTSVTLATNALQSISGQKFLLDAGPGILAAAAVAKQTNGTLFISPPRCVSPCNNSYPINSFLSLPFNGLTIKQAGNLLVGETIETNGNVIWDGSWVGNGTPQFGINNGATINDATAEPAFHLKGTGNSLNWLQFSSSRNASTMIVTDNAGTYLNHVNLVTDGSASTDYLGMGVVYRDNSNTIADHWMDYGFVGGGPDQVNDKSWTPLIWLAHNNGGIDGEDIEFHNMNYNRRGVENDGGTMNSYWSYRQGGINPMFLGIGPLHITRASQDTEGLPLIADISVTPPSASRAQYFIDYATGGTTNPLITGARPKAVYLTLYTGEGNLALPDVNRGLIKDFQFANATASPYDTTGSFIASVQPLHMIAQPDIVIGGYSKYWALSPPTSITASGPSSGGSVPVGTFVYSVSATGIDNGETVMQPTPSSSVTTTSGNQTVTVGWTATVGAVSYNVFRCNTSLTCTTDGVVGVNQNNYTRVGQHVTGTSFNDTSASTTLNTPWPQISATGVSGMNNNFAWAPTHACPETTAPSGVGSWDLLYCDSTEHRWGMINNNNGVTTMPLGTVKATAVDLTAQAANIGATTIFAVPSTGAGFYRFSCYTVITQAATSAGTMPNCLALFTDHDTSTVTTSIITQFNSSNTLGSIGAGGGSTAPLSSYAYVKASTNIQYQTTGYASSGATPLQYALHFRLEFMGP